MTVLMQAVSSDDGRVYVWQEDDYGLAGWPGPGTPTHVAVVAGLTKAQASAAMPSLPSRTVYRRNKDNTGVAGGLTAFSVDLFGASPTASATDNATAIQACIEAAGVNGVVSFPDGLTYEVEYLVADKSGQTWQGRGSALVMAARGAGDGRAVVRVTADNVAISGLIVDGNRTAHHADGYLEGLGSPTVVGGAYRAAIYAYQISGLKIDGCELHNCAGSGVATNGCNHFEATSNYVHHTLYTGIFVYDDRGSVTYSEGNVVSNNRVEYVGTIANGLCDVAGRGSFDTSADGILLHWCSGFEARGNTIAHTDFCDVKLENCRRGQLTGTDWNTNYMPGYGTSPLVCGEDVHVSDITCANVLGGVSAGSLLGYPVHNCSVRRVSIRNGTFSIAGPVVVYDEVNGLVLSEIVADGAHDWTVMLQRNRLSSCTQQNIKIDRIASGSRASSGAVNIFRSATTSFHGIEIVGCNVLDCGNGVYVSGTGNLVANLNVHDNYFSATPSGGPVVDNGGVASGEYRNNHSPNPASLTSPGWYRVPRVLHGSVDITGTDTTAAIVFASIGLPDAVWTLYRVTYGITPKTGSPAGLGQCPWTTAKATSGFTINLATAPGSSTAVTVDFTVTDIGTWAQ